MSHVQFNFKIFVLSELLCAKIEKFESNYIINEISIEDQFCATPLI